MKADQEQRYSSDSERRSEKKAGTIRTLKDAGCDDALIRRFLFLQEDGEPSECLCLLFGHRRRLLEMIHEDQKRIDILDYLIYTIGKEEKGGRKR